MKKLLLLFCVLYSYSPATYSQSSSGYHTVVLDSGSFATIATSINDAGIVGLGESTHWSKEMTVFKVEFIKYLMVNTDYKALVLEDNFYECSQINNYLQTGEGDLDALHKQLMGVWQSPDFLDLLKWMREHNAQQSSADRKVSFYGADMQRGSAVQQLISYTSTHSDGTAFLYLDKLADKSLNLRNQPKDVKAGIAGELAMLASFLQKLGKDNDSLEQQALHLVMQQQLETLKQYYELETASVLKWATYRDKKMAENVMWTKLQENKKNNKVLIWAHNGHLRNSNIKMGKYLKQVNSDYFILAQDFISGHTRSNKKRELHYPISENEPLFANYFLDRDGAMFFVNFQETDFDKSDLAQYMQKNPLVHDEGVTKNTLKLKLRKQFDAIIIHRTTSPKF